MRNEFFVELVMTKIQQGVDLSRDDMDMIRAILESTTPTSLMPTTIVICPTTHEPCGHKPTDCDQHGCLLNFPG